MPRSTYENHSFPSVVNSFLYIIVDDPKMPYVRGYILFRDSVCVLSHNKINTENNNSKSNLLYLVLKQT